MAKFCVNCGGQMGDNDAFCLNCGHPLVAPAAAPVATPVQPEAPVYQQPVYQQPVYQQPVYQQPVYQQPVYQPVYAASAQPITVQEAPRPGRGLGIVSMVFGIISLVYSIVVGVVAYFTMIGEQVTKYSSSLYSYYGYSSYIPSYSNYGEQVAEDMAPFFVILFVLAFLSLLFACIAKGKGSGRGPSTVGLVMSIISLCILVLSLVLLLA